MRLIRLTQQPRGISEDIRAALASIGRGANVVGGVALVGVAAASGNQLVDAVVLLPKGVLIVTGISLPDPAMHLHAPLYEQWKADGWPLTRTDGAVNPAHEALRLADDIAERLRQCARADGDPEDLSIGTVIAVGPYVDNVEQPAAELAGTVRVLHPTATSMLAAAVSLATASRPSTVARVRALITAIAPAAETPSEQALLAEGFGDNEQPTERSDPAEHLRAVESTIPAEPPQPSRVKQGPRYVTPPSTPAPVPTAPRASGYRPGGEQPRMPGTAATPVAGDSTPTVPRARRKRDGTDALAGHTAVRLVPMAAIGLLSCLLVAAIVLATVHSGGSETVSAEPTTSPAQPGVTADGVRFVVRSSASTTNCAAHAFGDIKTTLRASDCLRLRRASFTAPVHGQRSAVTVAVLGFASEEQAKEFKRLADTPGTGGIRDLATQTGTWPGTAPRFARAAYASIIDAATVRLVRADWISGQSKATDAALARVAHAALRVPLP